MSTAIVATTILKAAVVQYVKCHKASLRHLDGKDLAFQQDLPPAGCRLNPILAQGKFPSHMSPIDFIPSHGYKLAGKISRDSAGGWLNITAQLLVEGATESMSSADLRFNWTRNNGWKLVQDQVGIEQLIGFGNYGLLKVGTGKIGVRQGVVLVIGGRLHYFIGLKNKWVLMGMDGSNGQQLKISFWKCPIANSFLSDLIQEAIVPSSSKGRVRILSTSRKRGIQASRARAAKLYAYLRRDAAQNDYFDIDNCRVSQQGTVRFCITKEDGSIGYIIICGLTKYAGADLSGRVVTNNGEKRIYFWEEKICRNRGIKPIEIKKNLIAQKGPDWEICWCRSFGQKKSKMRQTSRYAKFLLNGGKSNDIKQYIEEAAITKRGHPDGRIEKMFERRIQGKTIRIRLQKDIPDNVCVVTTRLGKPGLYLIEVFRSREQFDGKAPAIKAAFVAVRKSEVEIEIEQFELSRFKAFQGFMRGNPLNKVDLDDITCLEVLEPYLGQIDYPN